MIHFVYPLFLYIGIPIIGLFAWGRWYYYQKPYYSYSSLLAFKNMYSISTHWSDALLFTMRLLILICLITALARPRQPDEQSKLPVEGIDIMLVLDVSDSMQLLDDAADTRSRFDVARSEALNFINKRAHDPIGIVLFANNVISRCPLTLDKALIKKFLQETHIGIVDANGTMLSKAIITAANRLKNSTAKSKIMIVLTDGEPTPGDNNPQDAIILAKKLGIKIYTVGIGSAQGGYIKHPQWGLIQTAYRLNTELLRGFARETGGQFFHAKNPQDIERIYQTIDQLEKSEHEAHYAHYTEFFIVLLWITLVLCAIESIASSWKWLSL